MEYINSFKRDLHNPINIKGFYAHLNSENIREDVNVKNEEAALLNEKIETKMDVNEVIKSILSGKLRTNPVKTGAAPPPPTKAHSFFGNFIPIETNYSSDNTLEKQLEMIEMESLKSKIRGILRDIKIQDSNYNVDLYNNIISNEDISRDALIKVLNILEGELSSNEGRTLVQEGLLVLAGAVESYFDGKNMVFGHPLDLTGLSDNLEVSLRKRKTETSTIHRQIKEGLGMGPSMQIGLDIFISTISTAQRNSKGTNNVKRSVKLKKKLDETP